MSIPAEIMPLSELAIRHSRGAEVKILLGTPYQPYPTLCVVRRVGNNIDTMVGSKGRRYVDVLTPRGEFASPLFRDIDLVAVVMLDSDDEKQEDET